MKAHYPRYGTKAKEIERTLTTEDRELLDGFLKYCAMTAGKGQVDKHRRNLLYFRDVVERPLDSITHDDAITFWGLLRRAPYEEHTRIAVQKSVKRFLKWYYKDYELMELLKIRKNYLVNNKRVNKAALITSDELQLMLHRAEKIRDKALLILLYETAARPQEIRDLKWCHVNWDEGEVHLYSNKTQCDRDLPIREALKHLKRWHDEWVFIDPKDDDFIFPSRVGSYPERGKPMSVAYINRIIKAVAKKAGITREINTYLLRHTRLTEVSKKGVKGTLHNLFAGHVKGSAQEAVYVHLDNDDMKEDVLDKVYRIEEISVSERDAYEQRVTRLEQQLHEVMTFLKESRDVMAGVKGVLATSS